MDGSEKTPVSGVRYFFLQPERLLLVALLLGGASLLRPEVTLLRLGALAAVLAVVHIWCEGVYAGVMSRGTAREFTLHFGNFLLVVVLGTVLAIWWGWRSTAVVAGLDFAWHGLAGLLDRASVERPAKTVEQLPKTIKRLPPGQE